MDLRAWFWNPIEGIVGQLAQFAPQLLAAVVTLAIGWPLAAMVGRGVAKILSLARLDALGDRTEIHTFLKRGGIEMSLSRLLGRFVYWSLTLLVFIASVHVLGLTVATQLLDRIVSYLPNVVAAIFILVFGIFFASMFGSITRTSAANAGMKNAEFLGRIAHTTVIGFATITTLEQLQIATRFIEIAAAIVLGSIGLGVAIAIGLGGRDTAARLINEYFQKGTNG